MGWYTYILRCGDGSLYTGITTDLPRRLAQHQGGRGRGGAKYTGSRHPLGFECAFLCRDRSAASRLEYRLKQLSRSDKLRLISGDGALPDGLEDCERLNIDAQGHIL